MTLNGATTMLPLYFYSSYSSTSPMNPITPVNLTSTNITPASLITPVISQSNSRSILRPSGFITTNRCSSNVKLPPYKGFSRSSRRCWVPGCMSTDSKPARKNKLYSFPTDVKKCRAWLKAVGDPKLAKLPFRKLTTSRHVCKKHFLPNKITPANRTANDAYPVLSLGSPLSEDCLRVFDERMGLTFSDVTTCNMEDCDDSVYIASVDEEIPQVACDGHLEEERAEQSLDPWFHVPPKNVKFVAVPTEIKSEIEDQLVDSPDDFLYEDDPSLQVAAHLDHDYVAVQKSAQELLLESRQKQLEERNAQKVLENVKRELCRICGQKGQDLMPIFEISLKDQEDDLDMSAKVAMHLPLKVERSDTLPLHICQTCSDLLTSWHDLYVTCVAADAVLQKTFGIQKADVPSDTAPNSIGRTEDEMEHPVTSNVLGDDLKTSLEMDTSPLNEAEEICEICGLSRSREAKKEGTEFQNVLDNIENIDTKHPYLCKICRDPFGSTMDRRNHFMMCRQLATICDLCGAEVKHRKDLTRHKFIAHFRKKVKPVVKIQMCDKCGKCFKSKNALRVHRCADENSTPKHVCKSCCSLFSSDLYYAMHMKRHEEGKVKLAFPPGTFMINEDTASHICPVCQEEFDSELSLAIHLTSKKQMKCVMCKKKVANEKRLMLHSCKKWVCRLCDRSFCGKWALDNHERIHTGEKPYKCNLCDATFRTPNARIRHQTVHNPTLLNCTFCSKVFKSKYIYRDHVNSHLGFYLSCKICEKQFSSRKSLYKHTVRFHRTKSELS